MNQFIGGLVIMAGMITGGMWYGGKLTLPKNPLSSTTAVKCCDNYKNDLKTIYSSAAKRIRNREILGQPDLKQFFTYARDEAHTRCFAPMGKELADSIGSQWDADKAAAACDQMAAELK
jgi:hypothetical protein